MRITQTSSRRAATLVALALFAAIVPALATAPRAIAGPEPDDGFYLDTLSGLHVATQYSKQTLLSEGHKVCIAIQKGASEDAATSMVQADLHASNYDAYRLITAVELGLDCFTVKVHGN